MNSTVGATVLYTDLVDSTALTTSVSAAEAERIRHAHFDVLGKAIEDHGGHEVKKLGDGIMAVFPGASSALDAGIAMQQAIARHNQRDPGPDLSIRVAVSTGDCVVEDGDYFGEPVIQAARLCGVCEGDQILVAGVIGFLVPRDAYDLEPVGDLQLKGIPEPFPTLALSWQPVDADEAASTVPLPSRLAVQTGLSGLVGRVDERRVLDDALKAADAGERRVVLVTGEAGLGKTRLTAEFSTDASDAGTVVLYGRCDEELAVPYLPWVESLSHLVAHRGDGLLDDLEPSVRLQLVRLLPTLRDRADRAGAEEDEETSGDQYALFGAVCALLDHAATGQTVLVVLDDLHWADRGTLQLLQHVATSLPRARLLVIGTYRETDLAADDPLTETSARLHRVHGVDRIALQGLSDGEVVALLESAAGHDLDEQAVQLGHVLRTDTAGNPFFVVEVIRHLVETGAITEDEGRWSMARDLSEIELPQSVRDVVGQRVRRLAGDARGVLTAAAVIGREFDTGVVAGAADLDEDQVLDVLEEAMAAGLVAEVAGAVDRFSFTHALVQHTLYGELSESRRARMHRRVATCLEELAAPEPGELAKHWFAAVRPAELDKAVSYAIEAGQRAISSSAPDEAVRWFLQAFEALDGGDPHLRCDVQVRLGDAERQAGRDTYRQRLLDAARRAQELDRGDLLVAAALANYRGWHSASGEVDTERVAVLEAALERPEAQGADRARLLATLAGELTYTDDPRRFEMARQAEELGRSVGERNALLDALERVGGSINVPEMLAERQRRATQMVELTETGHDPLRRFLALEQQSDVLLATADIDGARRCLVERKAIAERLGQPAFLWLAANNQALLDFIEGDVDAAAAGADAAFELGMSAGQPDVMVYFGGMLMQIHLHRGQYAEIIPLVRERAEALPGLSAFRAVLINYLAHAGELEEASRMLAEAADEGFAFFRDLVWLTSTAMSAEAAVLTGDLGSVALLRDRLLPYADQVICTRAHCLGPTTFYLGVAASALGQTSEAEAHLCAAIDQGRRLRSPLHQARPLLALGTLLRSSRPDEAAQMLREAADLSERYGMHRLHEQADALLA